MRPGRDRRRKGRIDVTSPEQLAASNCTGFYPVTPLGGDVDQRYIGDRLLLYVLTSGWRPSGRRPFYSSCLRNEGTHGERRREKPRRLSDEMIKAVKPYDAGQN